MKILTFLSLSAMTAIISQVSLAQGESTLENAIVYIECKTENATSRGSGVVVSPDGDVLTARHVVHDGATCQGSLRVADPSAARRMVLVPNNVPADIDATILRFSDQQQNYEFAPVCSLASWMIRRKVFVAGFPGGTKTGVVSYREGVLSTALPNPDGLLETTGQTIEGMSGGPVFTTDLKRLVGIVIGAEFTGTGSISYYGVLPVSRYAQSLGLSASGTPCYRAHREVELEPAVSRWKSGDKPLRLGVHSDEGVCFLSSVSGQLNDSRDSVSIIVEDGEYVLTGVSEAGGEHGGTARCIWYD